MKLFDWLKSLSSRKTAPLIKLPQERILAPIDEQLEFQPSRHLTLGVEIELAVVNPISNRISPTAQSVIDKMNSDHVHQEVGAHILELTTGIGTEAQQIENELKELSDAALGIAKGSGLALSGTAHPALFRSTEFRRNTSERYDRMHEDRKILYDRFNSMQGMHIHIGMRSADECMKNHNFFMHFLPHLLALSASAPFEYEVYSGLASMRSVIAEAMPVAGLPYQFSNWQEYATLCQSMHRASSIISLKDLWCDLRPCPRFGTLEIRVCDQPATMAECMAIVAFVHSLAEWYEEHHGWLDEMPRPSNWRMRDNKWRAMRFGLDAELIVNNQGETRDIKTDILLWLKRLEPQIKRHKYEDYMETLRNMLLRGNSSQRQRAVYERTHSMMAVADFNRREWENGAPLWGELEGETRVLPLIADGDDKTKMVFRHGV